MTHRIELADFNEDRYAGGFVDIHDRRGWADQQKIEGKGLRAIPMSGSDLDNLNADNIELEITLYGRGLEVLRTAVVAWSLTDAEGQPLPANARGFNHADFPPDVGEWIVERIDAFYAAQRRTEEEAKA